VSRLQLSGFSDDGGQDDNDSEQPGRGDGQLGHNKRDGKQHVLRHADDGVGTSPPEASSCFLDHGDGDTCGAVNFNIIILILVEQRDIG
ncbi:MAG TPA: hypothetical protein VG815_20820, partial [Chloroflexota bacterium]|nr:hypothetical protein [Chloroflexota bacterium]